MAWKDLKTIGRVKLIVRRVVYALVIIGIVFFVWKYDLESIPGDYGHLAPQHMGPGTAVISTAYKPSLPLGIGSVIRYAPPGGKGRETFGVIAGLPGELITLGAAGSGAPTMMVADRKEDIPLPVGHKIPAGKIPEGKYLVLLGDRHTRDGSSHPDSRQLGLVSADWIKAKIISSLFFL